MEVKKNYAEAPYFEEDEQKEYQEWQLEQWINCNNHDMCTQTPTNKQNNID